MKIRALLFICCTTILVSAVEAKIKEDEGAPKQIVHIKKMDKRVSELMADRVNIRKNMELKELCDSQRDRNGRKGELNVSR